MVAYHYTLTIDSLGIPYRPCQPTFSASENVTEEWSRFFLLSDGLTSDLLVYNCVGGVRFSHWITAGFCLSEYDMHLYIYIFFFFSLADINLHCVLAQRCLREKTNPLQFMDLSFCCLQCCTFHSPTGKTVLECCLCVMGRYISLCRVVFSRTVFQMLPHCCKSNFACIQPHLVACLFTTQQSIPPHCWTPRPLSQPLHHPKRLTVRMKGKGGTKNRDKSE